MKRTIVFRTIVRQVIKLKPNQYTYPLFQDTSHGAESVTSYNEQSTVRWLFAERYFQEAFVSEYVRCTGRNPGFVQGYLEVMEPVLSAKDQRKIGDIDLLLVPQESGVGSIAFEFKRVKVISYGAEEEKVNKVETVRKKGIKQVNNLIDLGFSEVYLVILLQYDGRHYQEKHSLFRYSSGSSSNQAYDIVFESSLHPDAGVIYLRLNQPTDQNIETFHITGIAIDRKAIVREQPNELKNRIAELKYAT